MDKKLYDELVNRNIITDTFMTLEKINERGIKLEDIVTQPEMYKIFSKYVSNEEVDEETQPTQPTNPVEDPDKVVEDPDKVVDDQDKIVDDQDKIVDDQDKIVDDPDKVVDDPEKDVEVEHGTETEVELIKEEEGIVVDDTVEPVVRAPKSKSKKSKDAAGE